MKKITLSILAVVCAVGSAFSQANVLIEAPQYDGSSTSASGPNGTSGHAYHRAAWLIHQSELTDFAAFTNSVVTGFGFNLLNGAGAQVTGNFTVYLANTSDVSYSKGGTFSTIITGMLPHYVGNMTIPAGTATNSILLPLTTNFNYTGGGVYVAYEWEFAGPYTTTAAWYLANTSGPGSLATVGGVRNYSGVSAPATLTNSAFRPAFNFETGNTAVNEAEVVGITAPGKVPSLGGASHVITATIKNRSSVAMANIPVSLNITGANAFTDTKTIATLAAGATTVVSFNVYNPTNAGMSTMTVTVPADQNNLNNIRVWSQEVTCTEWANNPPVPATTFTSGSYGFNSGSGMILNKYNSASGTNLAGIRLAVANSSANIGKNFYGVLLNSTGAVIATTNTVTVVTGMGGTFVNFSFATPQTMTANQDYYLGVAIPVAPMFPFGSLSVPYAVSGYYYAGINGGTLNNLNVGYFGIEAVISATNLAVSASANPATVCKGQTTTLTAVGPANSTFTWSPGTATGSVAVVTPNLPGTQTQVVVNYNVSGTDGASNCPLNPSVVSVTVNAVPTIGVNSRTICPGSKATILPTGALTYTITGGSFTVSPTATTEYTVTGTNALGCTSSVGAISKITVDPCSGIAEAVNNGTVRLYPNPAAGGVSNISGLQGKSSITVFNTLGQAIISENTDSADFQIDLSKYAAGNYMVRIVNSNNDVQTLKLLNN